MSISFVHVMVLEGLREAINSSAIPLGFISIPHFVPAADCAGLSCRVLNVDSYLSLETERDNASERNAPDFTKMLTTHEINQLYWQYRRRHAQQLSEDQIEILITTVIARCITLLESTDTSLLVFGGIPHSFYDYILLLSARSFSVIVKVFQEFPWTPYGCIEYSDRLQPLKQPYDHLEYQLPHIPLKYSDIVQKLVANILLNGKAFVPELLGQNPSLNPSAQYWINSYIPSHSKLELSQPEDTKPRLDGFLNTKNRANISFLNDISKLPMSSEKLLYTASLYAHLLHIDQFQMTLDELSGYEANSLYILPLPSEPECSINPMCNEFVTTAEMVMYCLDALPTDATLLLKEHPGMLGLAGLQENPHLDAILSYRYPLHDLVERHNQIRWLPIEITKSSSDKLDLIPILYAAGTIGVESYVKGRPIIPFATTLLELVTVDDRRMAINAGRQSLAPIEIQESTPYTRCENLYRNVLPFSPVGKYNGFFQYSSGSDFISGKRLVWHCQKYLAHSCST